MLSASLGVDPAEIARLGDATTGLDAALVAEDQLGDDGWIELSSSYYGSTDAAVLNSAGAFRCNAVYEPAGAGMLQTDGQALPASVPSEPVPPAQRILTSEVHYAPMAEHSAPAPAVAKEAPRILAHSDPATPRRDGGGMIDITPRPGQPEVILARSEPPAGDRSPWLAMSASNLDDVPAEPPRMTQPASDDVRDAKSDTARPTLRVEGSQGRSQAFDLAGREAAIPARPTLASPGRVNLVQAVMSAPVERTPAIPVLAPARVEPAVVIDRDDGGETDAAEEPTSAPLDEVTAMGASLPASHDAALAEVSEWGADSLPGLAMVDLRRARDVIPLVMFATVGQHFCQGVLPEPCGPTALVPPRRKSR